ncbi:MAG: serine/threonine protein kinase [Planctomycetota bacterium]
MNELLKTGQVVQTKTSGQPCQVEKFLGGGGQGEVYQARLAGGSFALKWYYPQTATADQRETLQNLFKESPPSDAFLWPLDMASASGVKGFGYLMRLREPRFKGLLDLMSNRIDPTFRVLATVGLGLADSFFKLHAKGLCYRDISFGNAFFDPDSGEVLICDNDNVTTNRSPKVSVLGTPEFMAPEIVRRETLPSRQTDLYSLSVLLFFIFHIHHPLKGKRVLSIHCWDLPSQEKMFGTAPLFIFDPSDTSNRAVDKSVDRDGSTEGGHNALVYWPIFPQFLRDTFTRAFTTGLKDPEHGRVLEGEWRKVLSQLRDSIFYCAACGSENFHDPDAVKADGGKPDTCWSCKKELQLPFRIRMSRATVMLSHDGKLYPHHLDPSKDFDFANVCAEVNTHPTDPNIWGLKNCTGEKWVATMPDGSVKDIEPGRSVRLADKTKVHFGKVEGEIRY